MAQLSYSSPASSLLGVVIRVPVGKENIGPHKQEEQDETKNPMTTLTTIRQNHATKKPRHQNGAPANTRNFEK
jgi:hypothetical protein